MSERWLHIQPRGYYFAGVRPPRGARRGGGRRRGRMVGGRMVGEYRAGGEKMVASRREGDGKESSITITADSAVHSRRNQRSPGHRASLGRCAELTRFSARPRGFDATLLRSWCRGDHQHSFHYRSALPFSRGFLWADALGELADSMQMRPRASLLAVSPSYGARA